MSPASIVENLGLGGRDVRLPRESLALSEPRELLASRSVAGAFAPDGKVAIDTLRTMLWAGCGPLDLVPASLAMDIVDTHDGEVVWGGPIDAPDRIRPLSPFAHFLLESVARLWPLLPGGPLEGLPVVFTKPRELPFVEEWLTAFGVRTVELPAQGAVRFKRMLVPEPAWRISAWVAPEIRDIHLHARRGMAVSPAPRREVLWLSRSKLDPDRVPRDEARLESLLGRRVVAIDPGTMTLAELVGAMEGSRAVAGVAGSAFHTLLLAEKPPDCLYLCPSWDKGRLAAQQQILGTAATFAQALEVADLSQRTRPGGVDFPGDYRILIPPALRALDATVLPGLLRDSELAELAADEPASEAMRSPGLGGEAVTLPRGLLALSEPRDLFVSRASARAVTADQRVALDTLSTKRDLVSPGPEAEVVRVHDEEVVWGGPLAPHYGHFLLESVARLWPLLPGGPLEGLPVVFTKPRELPFVEEWLTAFGVRTVELPAQGAVRFKRMLVPEPAWRMGSWVAPEIRDIHLHARRGMAVSPAPRREVLWLSRTKLPQRRRAFDEALLEWLLSEHVSVIHLETMSLAEQAAALESSGAVAGVIGSAFHTLLFTNDPPDCLYLCPSWDKGGYPAQHRFLEANATFHRALEVVDLRHRKDVSFPRGFRLLIPESLRALRDAVLPDLLNDPRLAAFANPERHWPEAAGGQAVADLDDAAARVVLEPLSLEARRELGEMFEANGLGRCADEQFAAIAHLRNERAAAQPAY